MLRDEDGAGVDRGSGRWLSCSFGPSFPETGSTFAYDGVKAVEFVGEDSPALRGEPVEAAIFVAGERRFWSVDDEALVHQTLEVVVESAGAQFVVALRLANDLLEDAVAVEVLGGEGEHDVKHGR
jgi:hypothetical protein